MPVRERPLELFGQVAIIAGAANGMGAAICRALADECARVVLAGCDVDTLARQADSLATEYPGARRCSRACDVAVEADTRAFS